MCFFGSRGFDSVFVWNLFADIEQFADIASGEIDGEREILFILAPLKTSEQIMQDVNEKFGITSDANGVIVAIPTEKAYKI
ncbi:MAG: hypothetical protein J6D04_00355 [Clostridia bacterium]|nr:hypothetical protein [Clostridia bacterium]